MSARLTLMAAVVTLASIAQADTPDDQKLVFGFDEADGREDWEIVNDTIMGGVSKAGLEFTDDGTAVFSGETSLANNGGFASARSKPADLELDGQAGLVLRVRADGREYQVSLRLDGEEGMYRAPFEAPKGEWAVVRVPFSAFKASFRGQPVPDAAEVTAEKVQSVGVLIADGEAGPFTIEMDWIRAYPAEDVE